MTKTSKELFKEFCEAEKDIPLFLTYGWLETVAPNSWDVVIELRENKLIGALPYFYKYSKGLKYIELPLFTPTGGVWIFYEKNLKPSSRIAYEKEICHNLIDKLPTFDSFNQRFHPSFNNWLPFHSKGFSQTTWYKYIIRDITDTEKVFKGFDSEVRRTIRKAEKSITIQSSTNIDYLYHFKTKSNAKNNISSSHNKQIFDRINNFCIQHNSGEILIAKDGKDIHAAGLFIFDKDTCHFLITAADPQFKNSGATTLLIWHAIQKYSLKAKEFNLEGSMIPGIEEFLRGFGGEQIPYFVITKINSKILKIKNFLSQF